MKIFKKKTLQGLFAIVLTASLVLSMIIIVPKQAAADGGDRDYISIVSCSDYQKWYDNGQYNRDDWDYLQPQLQAICDAAWDGGLDPDYWFFGGDFSCLHNTDTSEEGMKQVKEIMYASFPTLNDERAVIIQGNHDEADVEGLNPTGPYEFDDFIAYVIDEDDYPTTQGNAAALTTVEKTSDDLYNYLVELADNEEHRPIFIMSHGGLHYDIDRQDGNNQYAYVLYEAIRDIADELDIIFMFGHNHTNGDEMVGGSITFFPPGSTIDVCHEDSISNKKGTESEINFTYMNYGYIGYIGDIYNSAGSSPFERSELTNLLTLSDIKIYKDKITVERYSKNGHEEAFDREIERLHRAPDPTPEPTQEPTKAPDNNQGGNGNQPAVNPPAATNVPAAVNPAPVDNKKDEVKLGKVLGLKVKKSGNKAIVTWKKVSGAKKYEVLCSNAKNFKKIFKKASVSKNKATIKKLKKGKKYFFKVHAVSGSNTGAYSGVKKIKL